jgi:hypothetical protein
VLRSELPDPACGLGEGVFELPPPPEREVVMIATLTVPTRPNRPATAAAKTAFLPHQFELSSDIAHA